MASCAGLSAAAQSSTLPDAPSATIAFAANAAPLPLTGYSSSADADVDEQTAQQQSSSSTASDPQHGEPLNQTTILPQQKRVFGVLSNYTSVSGGTKPKPAGWRTDSEIAWKQSTDYTAFGFGLVTSAIAYGQDSHPSLDVVNGGNFPYWAYAWRGLVDKTDQVVLGSLFFPALLHQDTRYYAMGTGSKWKRTLHAMDSVVVARSYSGRPVFNAAGIAGKIGTQALSTTYYPAGSEDFGVLTEKFVYALLRQAGFTVLREFSPDLSQKLHLHVKGSN
jgi:hypothetical protein